MSYYIEDGDSGRLHPMSKDESIEAYWRISKEDPAHLADLYVEFHDFGRVEFIIFRDRLSSAILIANSVQKTITELTSKFEAMREDGSHRVFGWEAESDDVLEESLGVTEDAYRISIGATIVTAVAALEGLLIDLVPDSEPRPKGLYRLLQDFLGRYDVPRVQAESIAQMGQRIGRRRNVFAHSLTGSYWETDESIAAMFTLQAMKDTLYTVGAIAIALEDILLAETADAGDSE